MFQYLLTFLLINSYYQSLGSPIHSNHSMIESLTNLSRICQNPFLVSAIKNKFNDCEVAVPSSNKKSIQCLIFYDINQQLCSVLGDSKDAITEDFMPKILAKQDVTALCTEAKDWVFTNTTKYGHKNKLEELFKTSTTCGEMCGGEENILEANEFCKYYKWGIELLKSRMSTTGSSMSNNLVDRSVLKSDSDIKASIGPVKNPVNPAVANTNNQNEQIKQTESSDTPKVLPQKVDESGDANEQNIVSEKLSDQTINQDNAAVADNNDDLNSIPNELENPLKPNNVDANEPSSKSTQTSKPVSGGQSDPMIDQAQESGKDKVELDPAKESDKDDVKGDAKSQGDLDYPESEGGDDENEEESQVDLNTEKKSEFITNKLMPKIDYNSHKEFYPNTSDGFTDDGDHFFPFFLTGIILVVLLYVLYHNKSKVSKVFFGLLVEGRQNGRRRNSRGHAYRRLDTLEQAMSANTAAPPSKIIY